MMGGTSGARSAYPSKVPEFTQVLMPEVHVSIWKIFLKCPKSMQWIPKREKTLAYL